MLLFFVRQMRTNIVASFAGSWRTRELSSRRGADFVGRLFAAATSDSRQRVFVFLGRSSHEVKRVALARVLLEYRLGRRFIVVHDDVDWASEIALDGACIIRNAPAFGVLHLGHEIADEHFFRVALAYRFGDAAYEQIRHEARVKLPGPMTMRSASLIAASAFLLARAEGSSQRCLSEPLSFEFWIVSSPLIVRAADLRHEVHVIERRRNDATADAQDLARFFDGFVERTGYLLERGEEQIAETDGL